MHRSLGVIAAVTVGLFVAWAPQTVSLAEVDHPPLPPRSIDAIESHLEHLSVQPGAQSAAGSALAHSRRALEQARTLAESGDDKASERARLIAWAAVVLAEKQILRQRELQATQRAERRAMAAEQRARRARDALLAALASRDRPTGTGKPATKPAEDSQVTPEEEPE